MVSDPPLVSVIFPIRNEAAFIERAIGSVLTNDYPRDRFEIIVVDGMSDDGTRELLASIATRDPRVRILDNPRRVTPCAMNIGIRAAQGDVIIRVDGHASVAPDFIRQNIVVLESRPEVWSAGGPVKTVNSSFVGRAVAGAMSSPVGVGNARFRLGNYEGYVDTIAFGSYWRWVFDKIGGFDEELVRNQDDELNLRVILGGGKIYMTPQIRSEYYPRTSLRKLARQYFQYGFWRIRTIQKHRQPATLRQIAPLVFVLIWLVLIFASVVWQPALWALLGFAALYAMALLGGTLQVARRNGLREAVLAPLIFGSLHFAYGLGSLKGLIWFIVLRRGPAVRPEDHAMSR